MSALRRPPDRPAPAVAEAVPRRGRPPQREGIARSGRLAGLEAHDLAARFGTPAYLYDVDLIERRYAALRAALPSRVDIAYAVKANPALAIVDFLGRQGAGADVASSGELATALRAGIDPSRIVMTGPGKRDAELQAAVAAGVRAVTVESPNELARLEALAAARGEGAPPVPVLLRMAVGERARLERVRLVGDDGAGKFGMDAPRSSWRRATARPRRHISGSWGSMRSAPRTCSTRMRSWPTRTRPSGRRERSRPRWACRSGWSTWAAGWASPTRCTRTRSTCSAWAMASPR